MTELETAWLSQLALNPVDPGELDGDDARAMRTLVAAGYAVEEGDEMHFVRTRRRRAVVRITAKGLGATPTRALL